MPKGKKNWAFRELANMLDHNYGLAYSEQLEVAERLVEALRALVEYEAEDAERIAKERRANFRVI